MLSPVPSASAPTPGQALGTLVPCHRRGGRPGCAAAPAAPPLVPFINPGALPAQHPTSTGERALGRGREADLRVCRVFFFPPEPVIYKLIKLLMKPPEIRASVVRSQLCHPHFPRLAT